MMYCILYRDYYRDVTMCIMGVGSRLSCSCVSCWSMKYAVSALRRRRKKMNIKQESKPKLELTRLTWNLMKPSILIMGVPHGALIKGSTYTCSKSLRRIQWKPKKARPWAPLLPQPTRRARGYATAQVNCKSTSYPGPTIQMFKKLIN